MDAGVSNRVSEFRTARGISASALAEAAGIGRQTVYAIEAGTYLPNTAVALRLARALNVTVEDLFSLDAGEPATAMAEWLGPDPAPESAVRLCDVGSRLVAVPAEAGPAFLPAANGIVHERIAAGSQVRVTRFARGARETVLIAGCDPALSILARHADAAGLAVALVSANSTVALEWLKQGRVHVAGTHLGSRAYPSSMAITFAEWEEGLLLAHGNPKGIRGIADLARPDIRIVNREPGSGSRRLLDAQLESAGIPVQQVRGYADEATGHLAAAWRVHSGIADACVATRSAALAFGLAFLPLKAERFDLVLRRATCSQPAVSRLMDLLTRAEVRRELEAQAACDTNSTGREVADSRPARRRG